MASKMALLLVAALVLFAAVASEPDSDSDSDDSKCSLPDLNPLGGCGLSPVAELCKTTLTGLRPGERSHCLCDAIKGKTLVLVGISDDITAAKFITKLLTGLGFLDSIVGVVCALM